MNHAKGLQNTESIFVRLACCKQQGSRQGLLIYRDGRGAKIGLLDLY